MCQDFFCCFVFFFFNLYAPLLYKWLIHCWISIVKRLVRKSESIKRAINASIELKRTIKYTLQCIHKYKNCIFHSANFALYFSRDLIRFNAISPESFLSVYRTNRFLQVFRDIFLFFCGIFWFVKCVLEVFVPSKYCLYYSWFKRISA